MAVYDGFFDAVLDEETGEADRAYGSGDFTGYFEKIIGSGVCIHNDPDSFRVRMADGSAVVSPGYLFIQGYWLRNDANYTIPLTGDATLAIAAHLNLGKRMIELEAVSVAQSYPDTLVLALVNPAANTAEDTRYNTDLCGVIDTAEELSKKVTLAINYIDNEIEDKLVAAEADIAEQSKRLDAKIAEVQAQVDKIAPPPVGTIQFSASQNVGEEWLRCDGSFISESQYPDLVAALGKLTPSGDKFQLLSDGEIGPQISNGVLYGGRLWVYSYAARKLYGIDTEGTSPVKEIALTSEMEQFSDFSSPTMANPIALSIVPHISGAGARLFLAQIIAQDVDITSTSDADEYKWLDSFLLFQTEFSGNENSLVFETPFKRIDQDQTSVPRAYLFTDPKHCVPYVVSRSESGEETYFCLVGASSANGEAFRYLKWADGTAPYYSQNEIARFLRYTVGATSYDGNFSFPNQRLSFSEKNQKEAVSAIDAQRSGNVYTQYAVKSEPLGTFSCSQVLTEEIAPIKTRNSVAAINVAGPNKVISCFDTNMIPWLSIVSAEEKSVDPGISLPSAARVFPDAAAYLWGKDIYLIFVGTGIIFSRTLEEGSFGYLDTTSVLGTITQFGYLDYSQDEGTLYIVGQDTSNRVKAAKIVLNTLYDYANDGAWLPMIASDGVPAYIKAKADDTTSTGDILTVITEISGSWAVGYAVIEVNGEILTDGTHQYNYPGGTGSFTATIRAIKTLYNSLTLYVNGTAMAVIPEQSPEGTSKTVTLSVAPYMASGVTLEVKQ